MKKWYKDEELSKKYHMLVSAGIAIVLACFVVKNLANVISFLKGLINVLSPFIWGLILAIILMGIQRKIEKVLPDKLKIKTRRLISSISAVLLLVIILAAFVSLIMPQIASSVSKLATQISYYTSNASAIIENLTKELTLSQETIEKIYEYSSVIINAIWTFIQESIPSIVDAVKSAIGNVFDFLIALIVAIYILNDKEKIKDGFDKINKALFSAELNNKIDDVLKLSVDMFVKFLEGKLLDSLIIGVICFIVMSIMKMDYAVLISFVIGITNIIPFFGPFIGAIPSAFILLIVNPIESLKFIIFIIILQQIDGNIIGPRILGDSVGLSSLWIMFAIIVGGAYFGFAGMLFGVPVFAIIYLIFKNYIDKKVKDEN